MSTQQIADLAWAGQHEPALAAAAAALKRRGLSADLRMTLHDLRAESLYAIGDLKSALAEAQAMKMLARAEGGYALQARALAREAYVHIRRGDPQKSATVATVALRAAERSGEPALVALCLSHLALANGSGRIDLPAAIRDARRAASMFASLGDRVMEGRSRANEARALWALDEIDASIAPAKAALDLARQTGDLVGQATALNSLALTEADLGLALRMFTQSSEMYAASGYVLGQAIGVGNVGATCADLGLYRRARRMTVQAIDIALRGGSRGSLPVLYWNLAEFALTVGSLDDGRRWATEAAAASRAVRDRRFRASPHFSRGLACAARRASGGGRASFRTRRARGERHRCAARSADRGWSRYLAADEPAAALAKTRQATQQHKAMRFAPLDMIKPQGLWWRHSQALAANGRRSDAIKALEQAWKLLLRGMTSLGDEGMRRNYLNKRLDNREIVHAWLEHARERKLPPRQREAHLTGKVNFGESVQRLVDTGVRLNETKSAAELSDFLVDEVTELSGAERVLLVLESPDAPNGFLLAGSLVRAGEDDKAVLETVTPWLVEARRNRAVGLRHMPDDAPKLAQHSSLVVPLVLQRDLLGYIYCRHRRRVLAASTTATATSWRCSPLRRRGARQRALRRWLERKVAERTPSSSSARASLRSSTASSRASPGRWISRALSTWWATNCARC
jgi:tetratricopeptide (TPR) repeat protein